MKRFFLYFLLLLFIAGLAMLAYGFWNAKNIRQWSIAAGEIKARHDTKDKEKNIIDDLNDLGGKKSQEIQDSLQDFESNLNSISGELESAKREIENLSAPATAGPLKSQVVDYYSQGSWQVKDLTSVFEFLNRVFETTVVFEKMTPDTNIEDIRGLIKEAKAASEKINPDILPVETKESGIGLKTATYDYLDAFDQYASGKNDSHDQLDKSYADFTRKQNDFWEAKKNLAIYANARKMDILESKIETDLMVLRKVKFSIK